MKILDEDVNDGPWELIDCEGCPNIADYLVDLEDGEGRRYICKTCLKMIEEEEN